jgi:hypothetical protein
MQHVQQMIEEHGGFEAVRQNYLRIETDPFMRLVIEVIGGPYPNGAYEVSVAHYGEQNGDAMRDPEITFLVGQSATGGEWSPLTFLNDYLGCYQVACEVDANGLQRVKDARLMRELREFAAQWDLNLVQQGFMDAFRRKYGRTSQGAANGATPVLP